jgi:1-deoxy-D-xylulose-5-phosphate synthase
MMLPDCFIQQDSPEKMYAVAGMNAEQIAAKVIALLDVAQVGARRA